MLSENRAVCPEGMATSAPRILEKPPQKNSVILSGGEPAHPLHSPQPVPPEPQSKDPAPPSTADLKSAVSFLSKTPASPLHPAAMPSAISLEGPAPSGPRILENPPQKTSVILSRGEPAHLLSSTDSLEPPSKDPAPRSTSHTNQAPNSLSKTPASPLHPAAMPSAISLEGPAPSGPRILENPPQKTSVILSRGEPAHLLSSTDSLEPPSKDPAPRSTSHTNQAPNSLSKTPASPLHPAAIPSVISLEGAAPSALSAIRVFGQLLET